MHPTELECTCREWWGKRWSDARPYVIGSRTLHSADGLPNAPVTVYVLTKDAAEAAQLLRLAADKLEREPELLTREPAPLELLAASDGDQQLF